MISRRRVLQAAAASPALVLLPGLGSSAGAADGSAIAPAGEVIDADGVIGLSLSWRGDPHDGVVARVRALVGGAWTEPVDVESDHHGPPDPDGRLHGPAVLVAGATSFAIVPVGTATDLRRHEIAASRAPLQAQAGGLTTVEPIPGLSIIERSNWTDRGRLDTIDCTLRSSVFGLGCRVDVTLRHGVVHHTVNVNSYSSASVPALLRGIQNFHMDTRGWDDIAYNFVIDLEGRIWHARDGDMFQPITGGHTLGFNAESVGVAVLGTFSSFAPSQAVVDSLGMLLGWKLGTYGVDPLGTTTVRSSGGDLIPAGEWVDVPTLAGHRTHQQTSCPGDQLNSRIPEIRAAAAELVPIFGFAEPDYGPTEIGIEGWSIERFDPARKVVVDITVDGGTPTLLAADQPSAGLGERYSDIGAGDDHGFTHTAPIDLDTTSVVVTAHANDGRNAKLMDLRLFATFIDVESTRFFAPGVYWMRANNLTLGTQPGLFEPMDEMTRGQMATFLHRFMDEPAPAGTAPFTDVVAGSFYDDAVHWLYFTGITTGISPTIFGPELELTRGQMATFLWRLAGEPSAPQAPFVDVSRGSFYAPAVDWLYAVGVTNGRDPTHFAPEDTITRGEMATFLHRLSTTPEAWTVTPPPSVVDV